MAQERVERRLAAILAADMVGYSRLMEADEAGTIARQKAHRKELFDPTIAEYNGRIVKTTGDGLLIEFSSAVDAVEYAVASQQAIAEREADVPEDRCIQYRVGINVGDIVIDGDDILGDGVNVAARLEGLAEPGGICVSGNVHEQVVGKTDLAFDDMGEQKVKNIKKPVKAFAVRLAGGTRRNTGPSMTPALELPDKPSIAVIPFDNMSGDQEQEYFADGITEDIITALSKVSEMFVIAGNSTFAYKGSSPDVRQVARELGVRNVLEGSVRKAGNRVRISAQLIDAANGNHLWAERYDRELADIFDLQDEITQEVVTALQVRLTEGEQVRLRRRQTDNVTAWEYYARGQSHLRRFNRQDNAQASELLKRAVALAPDFASAWSLLAFAQYVDVRIGLGKSAGQALERAEECAERSLALDDTLSDAHAIKASICLLQRRYDEAVEGGRRSVELGPNVADSYVMLAHTLNFVGRPDEALGLIEQAMRLSPFYPDWYLGTAGISYRLLGRYEDAIAADHKRLARNPDNIFSDFRLAANYEKLGRHNQARAHIATALKKYPKWSLAQIRVSEPYRDKTEMERYVGILRKAGMPE